MHNKMLCLGVILTTLCSTAFSQDDKIKQAVMNEIKFYSTRDMKALESNWVHNDNVVFTNSGPYNYINIEGWDSLAAQTQRWVTGNGNQKTEVSTDSMKIWKEGKVAIVDYNQVMKFDSLQAPFDKRVSHEHAVLMNDKGTWKFVSLQSIESQGYSTADAEMHVNMGGYSLLFAKKYQEAIQVLQANAAAFPDSWNVFDSLGEAYAMIGANDLAIANYEKSLALNPGNSNAVTVLKKLKK